MSRTATDTAGRNTECPVAAIAVGTQRIIHALFAAEIAKADRSGDKERLAACFEAERQYDRLAELIQYRRDQAIINRATSPDGALHQLAIASALAEELWELAPERERDLPGHFRAKEIINLLGWAFYSIAGVLEAAASLPRGALAVEYYMTKDLDPFVAAAHAIATANVVEAA